MTHKEIARDLVIRIAEALATSFHADIDPRLCEGEPLHDEVAAMIVEALENAALRGINELGSIPAEEVAQH